VDYGPAYPKGVVVLTHPGEYDDIFDTCNVDREHVEEGTLAEIVHDECTHTDPWYYGSGFDEGIQWKFIPHTVYIDINVWQDFSDAQKTIVINRAKLVCQTCGKTNALFVTDVFEKAWADK
jgi:hypothetical protein